MKHIATITVAEGSEKPYRVRFADKTSAGPYGQQSEAKGAVQSHVGSTRLHWAESLGQGNVQTFTASTR